MLKQHSYLAEVNTCYYLLMEQEQMSFSQHIKKDDVCQTVAKQLWTLDHQETLEDNVM